MAARYCQVCGAWLMKGERVSGLCHACHDGILEGARDATRGKVKDIETIREESRKKLERSER